MYYNHPKSVEDYVALVDNTLIEVEEFVSCLEFDMEDPGSHMSVLEPILVHLRQLRQSMQDGSYLFANEDLPFMEVANKLSNDLPFTQLLAVINETHREGLNIDDEPS